MNIQSLQKEIKQLKKQLEKEKEENEELKEEIDELIKSFPVARLHYVGTDMATNYMRETIDAMDPDFFELYLRYHFSICERQDLVGASHHILDVLRKE